GGWCRCGRAPTTPHRRPITKGVLLEARKTSRDTAPGVDGITFHGEGHKYRPLSLTSTICKMLERILLTRLTYKTGRLHFSVNGFVKHRSTANCLSNYFSYHQAKTAVFLHIEKAFDRAQPLTILRDLTKLGVKAMHHQTQNCPALQPPVFVCPTSSLGPANEGSAGLCKGEGARPRLSTYCRVTWRLVDLVQDGILNNGHTATARRGCDSRGASTLPPNQSGERDAQLSSDSQVPRDSHTKTATPLPQEGSPVTVKRAAIFPNRFRDEFGGERGVWRSGSSEGDAATTLSWDDSRTS
ncbi:hypothetical protein O3P69_013092, partial [Scylla paramamosain]